MARRCGTRQARHDATAEDDAFGRIGAECAMPLQLGRGGQQGDGLALDASAQQHPAEAAGMRRALDAGRSKLANGSLRERARRCPFRPSLPSREPPKPKTARPPQNARFTCGGTPRGDSHHGEWNTGRVRRKPGRAGEETRRPPSGATASSAARDQATGWEARGGGHAQVALAGPCSGRGIGSGFGLAAMHQVGRR